MRIQLQLSAMRLKNVAGFFSGVSDPYAIVQTRDKEEIGRTKSVKNDLSPNWCESICFEYDPEVHSHLFVCIYDDNRDKKDDVPMAQKLISVEDSLSNAAEGVSYVLNDGGRLCVHAIESEETTSNMYFHLRALDVRNVDPGRLGLSRTDPFLEIAKKYNYPALGKSRIVPSYRSEIIKNHLNPYWEKASVNLEVFCDGDLDLPLVITLYDYESSGYHEVVGSVETTANFLIENVSTGGNGDRRNAMDFLSDGNHNSKGRLVVMEAFVKDVESER